MTKYIVNCENKAAVTMADKLEKADKIGDSYLLCTKEEIKAYKNQEVISLELLDDRIRMGIS